VCRRVATLQSTSCVCIASRLVKCPSKLKHYLVYIVWKCVQILPAETGNARSPTVTIRCRTISALTGRNVSDMMKRRPVINLADKIRLQTVQQVHWDTDRPA